MPAVRFSASSEFDPELFYRYDLHSSSFSHNATDMAFARGLRFAPYPSHQEVFHRSNHAVQEDDDFSDLSLPDYFHVQRRVARHRFLRYRERMNDHQRGLFGRGLENREGSCGNEGADIAMSVSNAFSSSIGMALYENDVVMEDRVSVSIVLV